MRFLHITQIRFMANTGTANIDANVGALALQVGKGKQRDFLKQPLVDGKLPGEQSPLSARDLKQKTKHTLLLKHLRFRLQLMLLA